MLHWLQRPAPSQLMVGPEDKRELILSVHFVQLRDKEESRSIPKEFANQDDGEQNSDWRSSAKSGHGPRGWLALRGNLPLPP